VLRLIESVGEYYKTHIGSRFIRPALLQLSIDKATWDLIDALMEKDQFQYQGYIVMDELYREIAAIAKFVAVARRDLVPSLRTRINNLGLGSSQDRVIRDIAVSNFGSNLTVFADMINELYLALVEVDKTLAKGYRPMYTQMPELAEIGRLLVGTDPGPSRINR
jgi:hypothetical protein